MHAHLTSLKCETQKSWKNHPPGSPQSRVKCTHGVMYPAFFVVLHIVCPASSRSPYLFTCLLHILRPIGPCSFTSQFQQSPTINRQATPDKMGNRGNRKGKWNTRRVKCKGDTEPAGTAKRKAEGSSRRKKAVLPERARPGPNSFQFTNAMDELVYVQVPRG